jgi:hypothetical protein
LNPLLASSLSISPENCPRLLDHCSARRSANGVV